MEIQVLVSESFGTYKSGNHSVGISMWHLEWCTKYRRKMFRQQRHRRYCEIAIRECCLRHNIKAIELNVQPDHVHFVGGLPRGMTDIEALRLLKGFTSFVLFRLVPDFRKRYPKGNLWSKGSFASTVGYTELKSVVEYVRNQDIHHSGNHAL